MSEDIEESIGTLAGKSLEDMFDLIHRMHATQILKRLKKGNLSAAEMNAVSKFLSDNNITGVRNSNDALKKLEDFFSAYDETQEDIDLIPNRH